ncbi:hypothetical protein KKC83_01540 [Patescibacteria group bacterium]|nr:hypothetical protein [Candidatus Falkowbacteria bacterium]MBU4015567.1 hypothetical protein [Patescibacteria group bacterium]MBU4026208.1 hypothetical protein [Patescibacteria group bacterium]MBU4072787.1 hypothetical protein [Patescibacteria group bacterium]MBU4103403.1 hypothetical protein [Patescibacteria group bacterium]
MKFENLFKPYSKKEYNEKDQQREGLKNRTDWNEVEMLESGPFAFLNFSLLIDQKKTLKDLDKCEQQLDKMIGKAHKEALKIDKNRDKLLEKINTAIQKLIDFKKENLDENAGSYNLDEYERLKTNADETSRKFEEFEKEKIGEDDKDEMQEAA